VTLFTRNNYCGRACLVAGQLKHIRLILRVTAEAEYVDSFYVRLLNRPSKPPRERKRGHHCKNGFGLTRPNYPFCKPECKEAFSRPPDELVTLRRYPRDRLRYTLTLPASRKGTLTSHLFGRFFLR